MAAGVLASSRRRWAAAPPRPRCSSCRTLTAVSVQGLENHCSWATVGRVAASVAASAAAGQHPPRMAAPHEQLAYTRLQLAAVQVKQLQCSADMECNLDCTGASLFGGAAAVVLSGDGAGRQGEALRSNGGSARAGSGGSRKQSPNVAEKAAAHVAALLPDFRPKETVNEFLSEVCFAGPLVMSSWLLPFVSMPAADELARPGVSWP